MFDYRRARRRLQRQLNKLDEEYIPKVERAKLKYQNAAPGNDLSVLVEGDYGARRKFIELELRRLESNRIFSLMRSWGVDAPKQNILSDALYEIDRDGNLLFTQDGRAAASQAISDARFAWFKKWFDLLIPIVSTILSVIALIVSIIALSKSS